MNPSSGIYHLEKASRALNLLILVNTKSKNTHLEGKSKDRDLYKNMQVTIYTVQDPTVDFKYLKENINDVPHKMAIEQLFMTSPSSPSQSQESAMDGENLKPEEIIMKELKVTVEDRIRIEKDTRGQSESLRWYRERKGRITASIAKSCCSKGNPAATVKNILTVGKPGRGPNSPHIK
ncbi:uncharacterized protein LOC116288244 [Actinia tenebrosa]|uniref:Uncharacterized protein LOC116288244 n=1 Tax=Actinia tenebrosa TaxID=6105 RepID=A0A6P8H636_ACTTE|nr:uncharacterized protein LOC116288244 [Actinia tenebrosa]